MGYTGNRLSFLLSEMEIDLRMKANKLSDAENLDGKLYKLHGRYGSITELRGKGGQFNECTKTGRNDSY